MREGIPAPRPGEILVLAEDDYRYGIGPILARISIILARVEYHGEPWWSVQAEAANGTPENHGEWHRRDLYVREATLPDTRRPPRKRA
jgi:hypothetical protein